MWISLLLLLMGSALALEIGRVEVRERDVLIYVKGVRYLTLEVIDPPRVEKVGPNLDPRGLKSIYNNAYAVPCYGYTHYGDGSEDIASVTEVGKGRWAVDTRLLPEKEGFDLLPIRICPCFSDDSLKVIDFWNKPLEVACPSNSLVWINYTNRKALKEIGFEKDLIFKVRVRNEKGDIAIFELRIPNP